MFLRLLSLGKTFYAAFDDAVDVCKSLCGAELGLGVRMLVRTSDRVSDSKICAIFFGVFFKKNMHVCRCTGAAEARGWAHDEHPGASSIKRDVVILRQSVATERCIANFTKINMNSFGHHFLIPLG